MTWAGYHDRDEALRDVTALADQRRDGLLPWDEIPGAADIFGAPRDLLRELQMRWHTRLMGSIDEMLAAEPLDLESAAVEAWRRAAYGLPGVRAILDANLDHPAIAAGRRKDFLLLASAAGYGCVENAYAVHAGRAIEERARAVAHGDGSPSAPTESASARLVRRLREALEGAA